MKELTLVVAAMTLLVYGCSEQNGPVEPVQSSGVASTAAMGKMCTMNTTTGVKSLTSDGGAAFGPNIITTSVRITARNGGGLGLKGSYMGSRGQLVVYDVNVNFPAGALIQDTLISMTIDKTTFEQNAEIAFGPCGLVFGNPATLRLNAQGIAIADMNVPVILLYLNNGIWQPMPNSWGSFVTKNLGQLKAGADIPHFSRYAFGR